MKATSKKEKATHIAYAANKFGYTVRVLDGNETIDEYNGGNDNHEWSDPGCGCDRRS
jgi:hypothetical protein